MTAFAPKLLAWFDQAKRDLPWRRTSDPYAIWVSEIMLQQTRVDTVVPYYGRFLERFPSVLRLADAETDDVLPLWSGLGYYRRARELHRAARVVRDKWEGKMPPSADGLRTLPGVGAYTAGAIASIAYGEKAPLVDGNVARVYARLFALREDVRSTKGQKALWALAAEHVPERRPGDYNQALMELGATVCLPREPQCASCPLVAECLAQRQGIARELPVVGRAKAPTEVAMVALVLRSNNQVLFGKRPREGLFGGLWEPPCVAATSLREAARAFAGLPLDLEKDASFLGKVRHVLSHRALSIEVFGATLDGPPTALKNVAPYVELRFMDPLATDVGRSTLAEKVLQSGQARTALEKRKGTKKSAPKA